MAGDKKKVRLNVTIAGERNETLRAALEALIDEHGGQAVAEEFALLVVDLRPKAGRPGVYTRQGSSLLKAVWIAVEVECYTRKKRVKPALDELFKELNRKRKNKGGWEIDLHDEAVIIKSAAAARRWHWAAKQAHRPHWDRSLATAKKIIDQGWQIERTPDGVTITKRSP